MSQPANRRLVTEATLNPALEQVEAARSEMVTVATEASTAASQAQQTADALVPRMGQIEAMAGLAPGEVTDAQTANLLSREDTQARVALNAAIVDTTTVGNVIPDPQVVTSLWRGSQPIVVHNTGGRTRGMIEVPAGSNNYAFPLTRTPSATVAEGRAVQVSEGQVWEFSAWYRTTADYALASPNASGLRLGNGTGNTFISRPAGETALNTGWTRMTGRYTVPAGTTSLQLWVYQSHRAGKIYWADFEMVDVTAAEQKITGMVKANITPAGSVSLGQPPNVGTRTKTWNQPLCLYNGESPALWNIMDKVNRARQGLDRARLTVTGMSKMAGWPNGGPESIAKTGWPASLIRMLGVGPGVVYANERDSRWAFTGIPAQDTYIRNWAVGSTGAWTATFTSVHPFTGFRPLIYAQTGRTITVRIDGVKAEDFAIVGGSFWRAKDYTGLTNTTHTIELSGSTSGTWVLGIEPIYDTGVTITNGGRPGSSALDWGLDGTSSDWSKNFAVNFATMDQNAALNAPDGVFIGTGLNGSTPADIGKLIDNGVATGRNCVIVAWGATGAPGVGAYDAQRNAMYDKADQHDLAVIDFTALVGWAAEASARGLLSGDNVHETPAGYKAEARLVAQVLGT